MVEQKTNLKNFFEQKASNFVAGFFSFFLLIFLSKGGFNAGYEASIFVLEIMCLFFAFFLFVITLYKFSATQTRDNFLLWIGFSTMMWLTLFRSYLLSIIEVDATQLQYGVVPFTNVIEIGFFASALLVFLIYQKEGKFVQIKRTSVAYYTAFLIVSACIVEGLIVGGLPRLIARIEDFSGISKNITLLLLLVQAVALGVTLFAGVRFFSKRKSVDIMVTLAGASLLLATFILAKVIQGTATNLGDAIALKAVALVFFLLFYMSEYKKTLVHIDASSGVVDKQVSEKIQQMALQSEAIREKTIESKEVTRIKSELLANMSHELRTPMNSIIGFTSRVIRKTQDIIPEQQIKNLRTVERNAYQLLSLINTILDVSKIEAGRMEIFCEKTLVSDLVTEVIEMARSLIGRKEIELKSEIDEGAIINSDRTKIKQMLINLMGNAIKFTERGEIQITVKKELNIHDDPERPPLAGISIYVKDTGVGIKKESLPYIFDDYKQVDGSLTRKTGGTGLGLALVKRFSQLLGGSVSVESEYEKGTSFHICLPEDVTQIAVKEKPEKKALDPSQKTLVLYETNESNTKPQQIFFEKNGFEVKVASTVDEAFMLAKEQYPRLVVLDILAFDKRVVDLIKKIKGNYYTKDIRFCFSRLYNSRKYGYVVDVIDFVYKPVNKELVSRIVNLAARTCAQLDHILVVDHDQGALETMHNLLLQEGNFSVRIARGVSEALSMLRKQKPDIIFFNLFLPDSEGYKIIAEIGTSKKWSDIPILCVVPKMLEATHLRQPTETIAFLPDKSDLKREDVLKKIISIANGVAL